MTRKGYIAGAAVIGLLLIAAIYLARGRQDTAAIPPPLAAGQGQGVTAVPSVSALMVDPVALKAAAKACADGDAPDVMTLCDRVHSAQAQLLAQRYREGADPKGASP